MTNAPLMPKATAVWLVENTALSFDQIAQFCSLHPLEVKAIADGDAAQGIKGIDPVLTGRYLNGHALIGSRDLPALAIDEHVGVTGLDTNGQGAELRCASRAARGRRGSRVRIGRARSGRPGRRRGTDIRCVSRL